MTSRANSVSLTIQVHDVIRRDILAGRILPGTPLRLAALAKRFDVSMSVIREALIRLTEQNLVTATPNQGFRVVEISRADLVDLVALRVQLEGTAFRESIERGDRQWEASIVAAHYLLERATPEAAAHGWGESEEWQKAHWDFHDALGSACGRPRLIAITRSVRDDAELYYQLNSERAKEMDRDVATEHRDLLKLALARDSERAVSLLEEHLARTAEALLPALPE
jgi:DNA-binding GntR family transcriptional regulator